MAYVSGIVAINNLQLTCSFSSRQYNFLATPKRKKLKAKSCARISGPDSSSSVTTQRNMFWNFKLLKSVELDMFVNNDDDDEMSEGFFEAIEELERMTRETFDVLEEINDKLSARELQLVLVYFLQEGRDSWCTLEVFEWLQKEKMVDKEKME
ncbi:Pentatricopeptide repeat-containing protein [Abeliophyllum distichum]|uniref:Pentatricopeptide repeat-containing protein n=1 Tax=Abeliophyllum distichum TaxID=126358 RepID=A0ABD1QVX9_9LAMI